MAKTVATTTRSPGSFAAGADIVAEDTRDAARMLNWGTVYPHEILAAGACGGKDWANDYGSPTLAGPAIVQDGGTLFNTGSGFTERLRALVWIPADRTTVTVGAACKITGSDAGQVRITVDGVSATTLGFTSADNGTLKTTTVSGYAAEGWKIVTWELNHNTGSAADLELRYYYCATAPTATPPDPPNA